MKKKLYIIPGMGQTCNLVRYKRLEKTAKAKGYDVYLINPDWTMPISKQIFEVDRNSVIFGFSMGAILAYLIAKKYECKKIILASISPIHEFDYEDMEDFLSTKMSKERGKAVVEDIKTIKVSYEKIKSEVVSLAGEYENASADIIIPKTQHYYSSLYNEYVGALI